MKKITNRLTLLATLWVLTFGLQSCEHIDLQQIASSITSTAVPNAIPTTTAFPLAGSAIPVAGPSGQQGIFMAYGI